MTLEEMQAALDSEARKKAAKLEKENKHLTTAIRKKQERIDRMEFNTDGTIKPVKPTRRGVRGLNQP